MDSLIDEELKKFYGKLYAIYLHIKVSLIPAFVDCNNELLMNIIETDRFEEVLQATENEFEQTLPKIERKAKKCVFFGETSCGKSTLINATLQNDVLPEGFGSISSCFVEIKSISQKESFLVVNGEIKKMAILEQLNNFQSKESLPSGTHIDLFYSSVNCPMLTNDAVLIDTPGIDKDIQTDEHVDRYCNDADLIVMIVNSTSWLNNSIKGFIDRLKRSFTKLNLSIVFNFWDLPDNRANREEAKSQFTETAKQVLCGELGYSDEEADDRIHFLSAYERVLVLRDDEELQSIPRWQSRNDAFLRFNAFLQRQMEESAFERRCNYLTHLQKRVISLRDRCHSAVADMNNKVEEQSRQIKGKLNDVSDLEEEIQSSTDSIFPLAYKTYIEKAIQLIKNVNPSSNELLKDKLQTLMDKTMKKSKEDLKSKIKGYIRRTNDEFLSERILIVEKIYFPLYIDKMAVEYKERFIDILNYIAYNSDNFALRFLRNAAVNFLRYPRSSTASWTKDINPIRSAWKNLEGELCNSYRRFLKEIADHLKNRISSLHVILFGNQKDLENVTNEMKQFHDNFFRS